MQDPRITGQWMDLRQRPSIRAMREGGYEVQSMPNPNRGMGPYSGLVRGNYSMSAQPNQNFRPELLPSGRSAMELTSGYERRGVAATEAADRANFERDERANIGVFRDPRWLAMRQALFEAGDPDASRDIGQLIEQEEPLGAAAQARANYLTAQDRNRGRF